MELGDSSGHLVGAVRCRCAEGGQHEHPDVGADVHDVLEESHRGQLRPVEVVEDQGKRALLGQTPEDPGDGIEEVAADLARFGVAAGVVGPVTGDVRGQAPQLAHAVVEEMGQRTFHRPGEDVIEHLGEGLVRDAGVDARRAHEHGHVGVAERAGDLGRQPGLAGARLATDKHDLPACLFHFRPQRFEGRELGAPTNKRKLSERREPRWQRGRAPRDHVF
ncbi:MAG: hypothetical protein M3R01_02080 [Actinomycetota bacterium]|nr:hypothetical protein [Actinomycetota bacterium]